MAIIALPAGIASIQWTMPPRSAWVSKSGYSGKQTVIDRGTVTEGWRASVTVAPRNAAAALAWISWQAQMLGPVNTVELQAVEAPQVSSGALAAIGSTPSSSSLTFGGLPASQANYIKAGQRVTIYTGAGNTNPRLVVATAAISTDGGGASSTLTYQPPLPLAVPGRNAVLRLPFCHMRLDGPSALGWRVAPGAIYEPVAFELVEVLS